MLRDGPSLVDLALVPAACVMAFLSSLVSPVALLQRAYQSVVRTGFL